MRQFLGQLWIDNVRRRRDTSGCVEVAENVPGRVFVRDTKDRDGGILAFAPAAWRSFIAEITVNR